MAFILYSIYSKPINLNVWRICLNVLCFLAHSTLEFSPSALLSLVHKGGRLSTSLIVQLRGRHLIGAEQIDNVGQVGYTVVCIHLEISA